MTDQPGAEVPDGQASNGIGAIGGIDYTILLCEDIEPMRRFYTHVMGFEIETEVAGKWVEFRVGSQRLALRLRSRPYDGQTPEPETASVQLAFRVPLAGIETAVAQLTVLGVQLLEPVADFEFFGHRAFFLLIPRTMSSRSTPRSESVIPTPLRWVRKLT